MALFKISKGLKANLPSTKTEGYCYYTTDDSLFYIDYKDSNGALQRKALNAQDAETLMGASLQTILNSSDIEIPTSKAVLAALAGKSDTNHAHDGRYYTETEIDSKVSAINTSITNITNGTTKVGKAANADSATTANTATSAASATKATQDGNGKVIASTYETKADATNKLNEAKEYTDTTLGTIEEGILGVLTGMYGNDIPEEGDPPTIREIANDEANTALASAKSYTDTVASGKANSTHNHDDKYYTETEIDSKLSGKSDTGHTHSNYVPTSRTVNGKALSSNISLSASDVGALPSSTSIPDALSDLTSDSTHRTVTDTEKAAWNAKSNFSGNYNDLTNKPSIPSISGLATEEYVDEAVSTKADSDHNHDSAYDVKGAAADVQDNLNTVSDTLDSHTGNANIHVTATNKSNWGAAYTHSTSAHARTDATKVADSTTNGNILINGTETNVYSHPNSGVTAGTYKSVTVNAQGHITSGSNPTTLAGYGITDADPKGAADSALASAKTYADNAAAAVKNDLLNGAGTAYDTLKELGDLIVDNADAIDALETVASGKADKTHSHAIADVSGLQTALDGKAASSHGTHVSYSTTAPVMDGTASVGSASTVARSDHKHPTDTSRASKTEFDSHVADTTKHITSTERTNWGTAYTHSQAAHAPSNAQANQNAFSNIAVSGQTTVAADTATDTVTFVGSNVTITTDATNDKVTFSVADGSTNAKGVVQLTNSTSSTSTTTAATPSSVKSAYDLANTAKTNAATAQTKADSAYTLAEGKVGSLSDLGVTATATELNYVDGVTSNIQSQLDGKSATGHTHKYAGSSSAGGAATSANKINTDAGSATQPVYFANGIPVKTTYTLGKSVPSDAKFTDTTYSAATTSANGLMSSTDKTKLDNTNIAYGTCATEAATAAKVVAVAGNTNWVLKNGSLITVLFSATNTAESPTLNVNGTGAKNIYYGSSQITTSNLGYAGTASRPMSFMYDGTQYRFVGWGYDSNTTYTNVKLGHGYATCSTAAATAAKVASLSSYTLTTGGIVAVRFTYDVPANATLNINSKGAKAIYYRNAAITAGVIKAGDTATFIYNTYYRLISIDRWQEDIDDIKTTLDSKAGTSVATTSANGLMSSTDKSKLDGIATGATANTGTITGVSANGTSVATSGVANIPAASTSAYGVTKLSSATNSTSEVLAATPKAVKAAYDLANGKAGTSVATTSANGLMSAADKTKLDGIEAGISKYNIHCSSGVGKDNATLRYYSYASGGTPKYTIAAKTKNDTNAWALGGAINSTTPDLKYEWYKDEDKGTWGGEVQVITAGNLANGSTIGAVKTTSTVTSTSGLTACPIISGVPYYKDTTGSYTLPTASSSTLGGVKIGSNISISNGVISVPTASGTSAGVTLVYPAASCTTFSSDSGTVTPLAVQKGAKQFAITRPSSSTNKAITRYSNTTGDVQDSKIIIEDVTNSKDSSKKAQVIAIPAEGNKKMVYGYCTDQVDGTSFIGGVFDKDATAYPYAQGLAIGGTSGNLLWKGQRVLDNSDLTTLNSAISGKLSTSGTAAKATADANGNNIVNTYATKTALNNLSFFSAGTSAPTNTKLLWIDTTANTGGLKYYNGSAWVHVPVAFT